MEEDSFNQTFLTIESILTKEEYMMMERQFLKEISKTFQFLHKNEIIGKLHPFIIEEKEYMELYASFKDNQLLLPDKFNPILVNFIIHYFYFKEIKQISIKLIFELLDLAIFLNVNELSKIIISLLNNNLTDIRKVAFIRKNIFPFIFIQTSNEECNVKKLFDDCELFLLKCESIDEYISFYVHDYFLNENVKNLNLEDELDKRMELLNTYKINGAYLMQLLLLFKDYLIIFKNKSEKNFDFKSYAEQKIEKFINLNEMDPMRLNGLLLKLELNVKDFKIKFLNQKITCLENEIISLKQR